MRLAALWPRLTLTVGQWAISQWRAAGGLDYSLIDYQGVTLAAAQFSLEWWLAPDHAVAALTELWRRNLLLIANQAGDAALPEPNVGGDKRFQDKAWSDDPTLRLAS